MGCIKPLADGRPTGGVRRKGIAVTPISAYSPGTVASGPNPGCQGPWTLVNKLHRFVKHQRCRVCRRSPVLDELHSLIARDFGRRNWPPARCREKEKGRSQTGSQAFIHSGPGCLPGGHQFLIAVIGVMLMLVAFVRIVDVSRLIAVVLMIVALVDVVNVFSGFSFAHADYLPTQVPRPDPEFHCTSGQGRIQGMAGNSPVYSHGCILLAAIAERAAGNSGYTAGGRNQDFRDSSHRGFVGKGNITVLIGTLDLRLPDLGPSPFPGKRRRRTCPGGHGLELTLADPALGHDLHLFESSR